MLCDLLVVLVDTDNHPVNKHPESPHVGVSAALRRSDLTTQTYLHGAYILVGKTDNNLNKNVKYEVG